MTRLRNEARFAVHVEEGARGEDVVGACRFDGNGVGLEAGAGVGERGGGGEEAGEGVGVGEGAVCHHAAEEAHGV